MHFPSIREVAATRETAVNFFSLWIGKLRPDKADLPKGTWLVISNESWVPQAPDFSTISCSMNFIFALNMSAYVTNNNQQMSIFKGKAEWIKHGGRGHVYCTTPVNTLKSFSPQILCSVFSFFFCFNFLLFLLFSVHLYSYYWNQLYKILTIY